MRILASITALLGGTCLVVRHFIDDPAGADVLKWVAAGLLGLAVLALGLRVVPTAPLWLQGIVSVGVVALLGSVWVTLRSAIDTGVADLVVAGLALVTGLGMLAVRSKGRSRDDVPVGGRPGHRRD